MFFGLMRRDAFAENVIGLRAGMQPCSCCSFGSALLDEYVDCAIQITTAGDALRRGREGVTLDPKKITCRLQGEARRGAGASRRDEPRAQRASVGEGGKKPSTVAVCLRITLVAR